MVVTSPELMVPAAAIVIELLSASGTEVPSSSSKMPTPPALMVTPANVVTSELPDDVTARMPLAFAEVICAVPPTKIVSNPLVVMPSIANEVPLTLP